jgi:tRNA(adenine34) deaminase
VHGPNPNRRRRGFTTAATLDRTRMARALALAGRCAATGDVPVGALVVCDRTGAVLGESWNQRESLQSPCAHAETLALDAAALARGSWRLDGTTLYATLEPCIMCYGAAVLGRCDRIVYGAPNPTSGALTSGVLADHHRLNHRPVVVGGLMAQECGDLVREFFQSMREVEK